MCLDRKFYFSPSSLVSPFHREQVFYTCKCGKCAECKEQLHREWNFRLYHEFNNCISNGGYVIMDCLSYSDDNLPHIMDFIDDVCLSDLDIDPSFKDRFNCSCFNPRDFELFMKRFRKYFGKSKQSKFKYFLASEYGSDDDYIDSRGRHRKGTIRPHYHLLLFVYDSSLPPLDVFFAVEQSWRKGRTQICDERGISFVLGKYVIRDVSLGASFYVSKYVQKDAKCQSEIDKRLNSLCCYYGSVVRYKKQANFDIMQNVPVAVYDDDYIASFSRSIAWKRKRSKLKHFINMFHRVSLNLGSSYLDSCDVQSIIDTGLCSMPDKELGVRVLSVPMYYKRKLFYRLVVYKGRKSWELNDLGRKYRVASFRRMYQKTLQELESIKYEFKMDFDSQKVAHYIMNQRGRIKGDIIADVSFTEKINLPNVFVSHFTENEIIKYGGKYFTRNRDYFDNSPAKLVQCIPKDAFIAKYVYFDDEMELLLTKIFAQRYTFNLSKQMKYDIMVEYKRRMKQQGVLVRG